MTPRWVYRPAPGRTFTFHGHVDDEGAAVSREARRFWREHWQGRSLMAVGAQDPVLGESVMRALADDIRGCPPPWILPDAGHFVQEHGERIAREACAFFAR